MDTRVTTQERGTAATALAGLAATLVGIAGYLETGVLGVAIAVALGLLWFRIPSVYVFALGQLGIAVQTSHPLSPVWLLAETGLAILLVSDTQPFQTVRTAIGPAIVVVLGSLVVIWGAVTTSLDHWQLASVVCLLSAGGIYAMHRYQRVTMGLVEAVDV
ncbi:hypothetical protein ACH9L7_15910 [Haloferax sp. S1W]|uniref:hypothetical protein n=1 Tax=Haloferax sp. S1W TaxID=3377110 RepID=UPI0037C54843